MSDPTDASLPPARRAGPLLRGHGAFGARAGADAAVQCDAQGALSS